MPENHNHKEGHGLSTKTYPPPAPFAINWKHRERRNVSSVHESGIHSAARSGRDPGRGGALNKTLIKRNQRLAPPPRTEPLSLSADSPATMPAPETENQKKVLMDSVDGGVVGVGGLGAFGWVNNLSTYPR
jgi:hypothetical protein